MPKSKNTRKGKKKVRKQAKSQTDKRAAAEKPPARASRDEVRYMVETMLREDLPLGPADLLMAIALRTPDAGEHLAWLAAYDFDNDIARSAVLLLVTALDFEMADELGENICNSAEPVLLEAIRNKALPDARKTAIAGIYHELVGEMHPEELRSCFKDFDSIIRFAVDQVVRTTNGEPEEIEAMLDAADVLLEYDTIPESEDMYMAFISGIETSKARPEVGTSLLFPTVALAAEFDMAQEAAIEALATMRETECAQAAWYLSELGRMPAMGNLGRIASGLAEDMAEQGVPQQITLQRTFTHGVVTGVDGSGSRSLCLYFQRPDGQTDVLVMLLNDTAGIKDAWCSYEHEGNLADDFARAAGLFLAPCTLDFARELLAEAFAIHEENGSPIPGRFCIFRAYLGAEPIRPKRRTSDLAAYKLDTLERSPKLVEGSDELVDYFPYDSMLFASDAAYDYLDQTVGPGNEPSKKEVETFIREIAPLQKDQLLSRIAMNLEVAARAGQADADLNRLSAGTWLAMTEDVVPFHEVPLVRRMGKVSVDAVLFNLEYGYRNQEEADQAALEYDEEAGDDLLEWNMPE
ncbi:MAG: hypothetical protein HQ592_09620 [Planctomycetes bacterium]|nr:hypothetical protein [Planctomycetota bacterium]